MDSNQPLKLSGLSFKQIENYILQSPALIIPLGSLEPYGEEIPSGVSSFCCEAIASALACRLQVLLAPVFHYGCSTPFKAFGGCSGVKSSVLVNSLLDISGAFLFQGFKKQIMIDLSFDNKDALGNFLKRINSRELTVRVFSLHSDERVRSFLKTDSIRLESAVLSLAAYLKYPGLPSVPSSDLQVKEDQGAIRRWMKTGKDPQKLRRMFPAGIMSENADKYSAGLGRELFGYILGFLEQDFIQFIKPEHAA